MVEDKSIRVIMFKVFNYTILIVSGVICLMPIIHELAISLSAKFFADANTVRFWPRGLNFQSYEHILFKEQKVMKSIGVTLQRTFFGTGLSMLLTLLLGYALSKEAYGFKGRNVYMWIVVFTMLFNGGIIPTYMVIRDLGLMDSLGALIFPAAVNVWNVILMMNFFRALPKELEEASVIDGATHWQMLFKVFIPLSLPAVATLSLFTMVFHWNSWFDGLIYISSPENYPFSTYLQSVVTNTDTNRMLNPTAMTQYSNKTIKAAQIITGIIPIVIVYPFLQKYFVKGIILGSVKG